VCVHADMPIAPVAGDLTVHASEGVAWARDPGGGEACLPSSCFWRSRRWPWSLLGASRGGCGDRPRLCQATLLAVLDVYKRAWEQQDAALILTIFRPDAVYHERVLREPIRGHEGIAAYWKAKVVQGQGRIRFTLLQTYIAGATGIAEWEVAFDDVAQRQRKHMKEIAVLDFVDWKIASLR